MKLKMTPKKGKTKDLEKVIKHFQNLSKQKIDIGYFSEQGNHSEYDISYASLMKMHEYGEGDLPSRPVFEIAGARVMSITPITGLSSNIKSLISESGRISINSNKIAKSIISHMKVDIFGNPSLLKSNSEITQRLKGGRDEPLVDTGELRGELSFRTTDKPNARKR